MFYYCMVIYHFYDSLNFKHICRKLCAFFVVAETVFYLKRNQTRFNIGVKRKFVIKILETTELLQPKLYMVLQKVVIFFARLYIMDLDQLLNIYKKFATQKQYLHQTLLIYHVFRAHVYYIHVHEKHESQGKKPFKKYNMTKSLRRV